MQSAVKRAGGYVGRRHRSGLAATLLGTLVFLSLALAPSAEAQESEPVEYREQQLEAFAAASRRIDELNNKWMPQIAEAQTDDEKEALRREALAEMTAVVREEGLTVEEYNGIYDAAESDPELSKIIENHKRNLP